MHVSVCFFIYVATLALLLKIYRTTTTAEYASNQNRSTENSTDYELGSEVSVNNSKSYKFIVLIVYQTKVHKAGILFRPRYVLAPFTKLYYSEELNIYVTAWADKYFQNPKLIRRITRTMMYPNRLSLCDYHLSILEIESPFDSDQSYWQAQFMSVTKPNPGTRCKIVYFNLNTIYEQDIVVKDWKGGECEAEIGYLYSCGRESFICFEVDTPTQVDIYGSVVLCNNKIAASIPGYYIHQVNAIEYLPYYREWFYDKTDNLMQATSSEVAFGNYAYIVSAMFILLAEFAF